MAEDVVGTRVATIKLKVKEIPMSIYRRTVFVAVLSLVVAISGLSPAKVTPDLGHRMLSSLE